MRATVKVFLSSSASLEHYFPIPQSRARNSGLVDADADEAEAAAEADADAGNTQL